jgi:hypothetical protein
MEDARTAEELERWRFDSLHAGGFAAATAVVLSRVEFDVHRFNELIASGCSHTVAWRIVKPLEQPGEP